MGGIPSVDDPKRRNCSGSFTGSAPDIRDGARKRVLGSTSRCRIMASDRVTLVKMAGRAGSTRLGSLSLRTRVERIGQICPNIFERRTPVRLEVGKPLQDLLRLQAWHDQ